MTVADDLRDSYPAIADSVPRAREAVASIAASAGASGERLDCVRLAVSEALTNAVVHAYEDVGGKIDVSATVDSDQLEVEIADDGRGLRTARRHGLGLGLALMALSSDSFTLARRPSGGIDVRLGFRLAQNGRASGAAGSAARSG
jgi:anti-sigma regulatory factor (Ser/Thr protein kinase)